MDEEKQILVKFVTKLPVELKVSEAPVAVPTTLKRYGLSQIINHLLGLEPARPFDFVIHGELVRKSLEAHLTEHQLSAESLLEVEYVPAVIPPKHKQSAPHDDWVSAVDGSWVQEAVSGSYDGCARLWSLSSRDGSGEEASCSSSWKAHASGINALACSTTSAGHRLVVSAGKDRAVLLWQLPSSSGASPDLVASYKGHTDSVEALAISPDGRHLASSGWDGSLRMWRMGQQVLEEAAAAAGAGGGADGEGAKASSKKRKVSAPSTVAPEGGLREECVSQLHGHIHCISSLAFATDKVMFSGGWDHSVRRWDVATGINTDTYNGSKAVYTVACPEKGTPQPSAPGSLVAFGSSDRTVRLWDSRAPRSAGEALSIKAYSAHKGWVVGASWRPGSGFHLATASHDNTVKVWDIRTSVPLATLDGHKEKALCVAWAGGDTLLSGGADCKMLSYSMDQQLRN